ncbi:hypothetical protein HYS93_04220 [Candidatus Daviesbacteria bacterium]|nr:hypothetical protein [Candidatus Daviesbacteria bacterium]
MDFVYLNERSSSSNKSDKKTLERHIKNAWMVALLSATITFIFSLGPTFGFKSYGYNIWNLIDVGLMLLLSYGIYKKSNFAATVLFFYFLLSKMVDLKNNFSPLGLLVAVVFLYFYYMGMVAVRKYRTVFKSSD